MSKKITLVLLVLIVPFILSARGNMEAGNGQAVVLEENFSGLLEKLDQGEITLEEAREELKMMQNRFTIREELRIGMEDTLEAVGSRQMTPKEGTESLADQLKTQDRLRDRDPDETQDKLQTKDQTQQQDRDQDCEPDQDQTQQQDRDQDCEPDQDQTQQQDKDQDCDPDQDQDQTQNQDKDQTQDGPGSDSGNGK